jgi:hypothetical protein
MTSLPYEAPRQARPQAAGGGRVARLWQAARTQIWYKALDAVVTVPARPRGTLGEALRRVVDPRRSNYDRVAALVSAADHLRPGAAARLGRKLMQPDALPLAVGSGELLAYGSGGTVYLLAVGRERWVLKTYRRSLGLRGKALDAIAREFQQKLTTVLAWYGPDAGLVMPVHFLLLHSPLRRVAALASLQRYLPPPHRDLFADFSDDELLGLGQRHPDFMRQLHHFVHTTLRVYAEEARFLDVVGAGNVLVVPDRDTYRLVILDYGIFDLNALSGSAPKTLARIQERVERLRGLQAALLAVEQPEGIDH